MEFWRSKEGRQVGTLVHETANGASILGNRLNLIEKYLERGDIENALESITICKEALKRIEESVDTYYTKLKDNYEEANR